MGRVRVAQVDELREGMPKIVTAEGREILVVRWRDRVYALRNICPHQSASFAAGYTRDFVGGALIEPCGPAGAVGKPWDFVVEEDVPVIQCPWHRWDFRLSDGTCATEPHFRVRSYPTSLEDGQIYVEMGASKTGSANAPGAVPARSKPTA
jgi:3-phenylpropionate/trans-cinnamate dioxygenase ferredoxin subunit